MTQTNYSPYSNPQGGRNRSDSTQTPQPNPKKKKKSNSQAANLFPAYCFWVILFLASIGINVFNVYNRFAPQALERFIASGIYEFIFSLPVFDFVAFLFRLGALIATLAIVRIMHQNKLWSNPVWWILLFNSVFALTVGLVEMLTAIPFVVALAIVGIIQYLEILFWNAKRKTTVLWIVVVIAYLIEIWMQYDMLPFHHDYSTAWGLVKGMAGMSFNWDGFRPVQGLLALIGIFGIEAGDRMIKLVKKSS